MPRASRVYQFHPAILKVNRQTNQEAGHILRENLFVKLTTTVSSYGGLDLVSNGLRTVALYAYTSWFPYAASEITLITREGGKFDQWCSYHLFSVDEMTTFCKALMRHTSGILSRSSLSVCITGVATNTASISKLLKPLRRLHSLGSVDTVGHVSDDYQSILIDYILK